MLNHFKKMFLVLLLIVGITPAYTITAEEKITSGCGLIAYEVKQEIEQDESTKLNIIGCHELYDVELKPNYLLIEFDSGYAIAIKNNHIISEYDITSDNNPYQGFDDNSIWVYGGPLNYLQVDKSVLMKKTANPLNVSDEIIELNRKIVSSDKDSEQNKKAYNTWTGIDQNRFTRYDSGKWVNNSTNYPSSLGYPEDGICGTISAAIMLAYIQDYINSDYVPSSIRTKGSSDPGKLITTLYNYIDKGRNGTIPIQVCGGINYYLTDYSYQADGHRAGYGLTTFNVAKTEIDQGYPLCVGLLSILGSDMGDHWVTAYQYLDRDGTANDRYKCVGNQKIGQYALTIYVNWTAGVVYIF